MAVWTLFPFLSLAVSLVSGSPATTYPVKARQSINTLTTSQINAFKPYAWYANTGYCSANETINWSCGVNCQANPTFKPFASGGNGDSVQFWFVGYDPILKTVIVSHEGTDPEEIDSLLTDADFFLEPINSSLFTGVSSSVEVDSGFADDQAATATTILAAVQTVLAARSATSITTTGHSLGAALSLLDALYLSIQIPHATVNFIGFGLPRVGNQAFANLIDSTLPSRVSHVNNKEDPIPILPGEFLGFVHPSGEKHIMDDNTWVACPGQDNPSTKCSTGDVPNIFEGDLSNHDGPYVGVKMGSGC